MQKDFLRKDLLYTYYFNNVDSDRSCTKHEVVNGRNVTVHGTDCATAIIGLLYRVYDPSVESYLIVLHIGVARQGNAYLDVTEEQLYEKAYERALINPDAAIVVGTAEEVCGDGHATPASHIWDSLVEVYANSRPVKFVMTPQELDIAIRMHGYKNYVEKYPDDAWLLGIYKSSAFA